MTDPETLNPTIHPTQHEINTDTTFGRLQDQHFKYKPQKRGFNTDQIVLNQTPKTPWTEEISLFPSWKDASISLNTDRKSEDGFDGKKE